MTRFDGAGNEGSVAEELRRRGPVEFTVSQRDEPGRTVVALTGELDLLTVPRFAARLTQIVRRRSGDLVIDVCALDFIDSLGLQILLVARRRLRRQSRGLTVVCKPGPVLRAIERARLSETLNLVSDMPLPSQITAPSQTATRPRAPEPSRARARSRRRRRLP
jgi:anti-sigma B factor antagonist